MFSETERIWDSHYRHNHYNHQLDHGNSHHPHQLHQEDPQFKLSLNGKKPRKISIKTEEEEDGQVVNFTRRKRPITEGDQVIMVSKVCADCRTSKTPLWRTGPAGPKSLCNACGIRYRKRRRREFDMLEKRNGMSMKEKKIKRHEEEEAEKVMFLLKRRFEGKEETEAALLLMALSCGLCVH